jgi:hypothetical protein
MPGAAPGGPAKPARPLSAPPAVPPARPAAPVPAGGAAPGPSTVGAGAPASPGAQPPARPVPAVPASGGPAPRAPINPFLANDPNQKAKRLARALVSDMIAYHPQKREEGIRTGTLKQIFREEIKKSYEEYVDQVGKEFAETTSHFQDALNEVLAGGKKVF